MTTNYKEYGCEFIKEYEEPKEPYNIFSFSVFYSTKYIRFYKNYKKDISFQRQNQFLYNLTLNIQNLEMGYFGSNWYIRIFYDESLFNFKIYNKKIWFEFIKEYKNNKYVQFVKFRCEKFINKEFKSSHINLFGTLVRLFPIFEKNDLLDTIVIFDADNIITKPYFNEIKKFKKSNYDYNSFCSKYEFSYYKNDNAFNIDNCYIRCGMLSVKKKLPEKLWTYILYQLKEFKYKKFDNLIYKLFYYHKKLMPEKNIKKYKEFEYGMDEIVLNYFVKKFFNLYKFKMRVVNYKPIIIPLINAIISYLKYYYKTKKEIVEKILMNILKDSYTKNFNKNLDLFNELFYKNISFNSEYKDIKPYTDLLKNEVNLFNKIKLPRVIMNFIKNISFKDFECNSFFDYFYSYKKPIYF